MNDNADDLILSISADQATLRRSVQRIEQTLDGFAGNVQRKFSAVGKAIDDSMSSTMQRRINSMVGIGAGAAKEWTGALADQGKELERLRAKYSPLFATIGQYKKNVEDIKRAHSLGAISSTEYQAAMSRERQAALAATAAIKGRNQAIQMTVTRSGGNGNASLFNTSNLAAQGFDIATTAPFMPWWTVALQQGPQVAQVFNDIRGSGQSIGPAVAGAFMQILNPVSLVTIGVIAAGAALIQYLSSASSDSEKAAEALKNHSQLIGRIKDAWPDAASGLREYAAESKKILGQDLKDAVALYKKQIAESSNDAAYSLSGLTRRSRASGDPAIQEITAATKELMTGVREGNPDLRQFVERLIDIENQKGTPENIKEIVKQAREAAKAGVEAQDKLDPLVKTIDGVGVAAALQAKNIEAFVSALDKLADIAPTPLTDSEKAQRIFDDAMRAARTEADERNATDAFNAANKRISDQNPLVDMGDGRFAQVPQPEKRPNIELEGLPGEVEKQEAEARKAQSQREAAARKAANAAAELKKRQDDLLRTAGDRIEQIQLETQLIGKYGIAADNARFSLETWQKAEKLNLNADQKVALQNKIDQYAQLADALAKVKLNQDLADQARLGSLSKGDQQVVSTLRQYGLDDKDLNSPEAKRIRRQIQSQDEKATIDQFSSSLASNIIQSGGKIGKAFGETFLSSLQDAAKKQLTDIFSRLLTSVLMPNAGAGATAGGGIVGLGTQTVGRLISPTSIGSQPMPTVSSAGTTRTGIDLARIATSNGLSADVNAKYAQNFQGFIKDLEGTGYKIKSIGGYNYRNIAGTNKLSNHAFGDAIDINPQQNPMGRKLVTDLPSNVGDLAAKNGLSWGGAWNSKKDAMHFEVPSSAAALDKLASSAGNATKGLGTFGTGLGNLGQQLGSGAGGIFPAAPSASGGGGGFFGLFGGLFKASTNTASSQWNAAASGRLLPGLFADGGHVAGPGSSRSDSIPAWLSNGEFVVNAGATKKHRAMLEAINNGSVARFADGGIVTPRLVGAPVAPSLRPRSGSNANDNRGPGVLHVQISGASGDDHVRTLVKQGVGEGLSQYNTQQRRGGLGTLQSRYANQKG